MNITGKWGMRLLAAWLIVFGVSALLKLDIGISGPLLAVFALVTGVLILLDR